jgi:serine/threonine-protein kinase
VTAPYSGPFPGGDPGALTGAPETPRPSSGAAANPFNVLAAGQTFSNRYHIIRLLGAGGMGAVYQAWDAELGISVALKVIRPDVSADSTTAIALERRFKRELLLARQVSHKHVVRIHDLGDVDGVKYITMAYLQGADLASLLRQAGRLPVARTLHYARQIAEGLGAAHEVGVVHRDLKPANIMIDQDDHAVIMDFGIAESGASTGSGGIVGTLDYMAPEQAQAKATDHRADLYSFGMIVREMLVGKRVMAEGSSVADLLQRISEPLPSVRTVDDSIPEPVDEFVAKCLEPDAAKRHAGRAGPDRRERASNRHAAESADVAGANRDRCSRGRTGGIRLAAHSTLSADTRSGSGSGVGAGRGLREQGQRSVVRRRPRAAVRAGARGRIVHRPLSAPRRVANREELERYDRARSGDVTTRRFS